MRAYLSRRRASEAVIAGVLEACSREGLLDDRLAAKVISQTLVDRGYTLTAVRAQLSERGFDDTTVQQTLASLRMREDDEQRARTMAAVLLSASSGSLRRRRTSVARRLARRGFDPELISRILAHHDE